MKPLLQLQCVIVCDSVCMCVSVRELSEIPSYHLMPVTHQTCLVRFLYCWRLQFVLCFKTQGIQTSYMHGTIYLHATAYLFTFCCQICVWTCIHASSALLVCLRRRPAPFASVVEPYQRWNKWSRVGSCSSFELSRHKRAQGDKSVSPHVDLWSRMTTRPRNIQKGGTGGKSVSVRNSIPSADKHSKVQLWHSPTGKDCFTVD